MGFVKFIKNLFKNKRQEELEERLRLLFNSNQRLDRELESLKEGMWGFKKGVNSSVESLENKFGWRKVKKKLPTWKNEQEFVELFAQVYVLDDGYRKMLPPYVAADSSGKRELLHKDYKETWSGEYKMRCYMVTRLVLPGYYKVEDFMSNDSRNFTMQKMFGKTYQELVAYMAEHNFLKLDGITTAQENTYSLNFYEL